MTIKGLILLADNKITITKIFFLLIFLFTGCREDIDLPLDTTYQRLLVEGYFTTDTGIHTVIIGKSGDAYGKTPTQYISGATVTISDSTDTFILSENPDKKGYYQTQPNVYGVIGRTYTLAIENVDVNNDGKYERYTATSTIPNPMLFDSFQIVRMSQHKAYLLNIYGQDPGGRNFYLFKVYKNNKLLTDSTNELVIGSNTGAEGRYLYGIPIFYLSDKHPEEKLSPNDTITIESSTIPEDYYDYLSACQLEYYQSPFSGTPANIPTNIQPKDKAVGYFASFSTIRRTKIFYKP
jgi:hypothetical protein